MESPNVATIRRLYDRLNAGQLDEALALIDPEVEIVTRDGPVKGHQYFADWLESQRENFELSMEPQEIIEAGDDTVVVLLHVRREGKDPELGYLDAWPANVWRLREGRVVFMEGYQNRDKALRDLGITR